LLVVVVFVVGLIVTIIVACRITLVPEIHPDAEISSSWLDLPITVKNPSNLFDFKDVRFSCDMTEQEFESNDETKKLMSQDYYRVRGVVHPANLDSQGLVF